MRLTSVTKGNQITFDTDCFSVYALTTENTKQEKAVTRDNLSVALPLVAMGVSTTMLIVGLFITRKKKAK